MLPNQGFNEFDRLSHRSPSPMASPNLISHMPGAGISGWNGIPQEVTSPKILRLPSYNQI